MKNITKLVFSILVCQIAGIIGSLFTSPSIANWYQTITKPVFTPPNWIFAPVWIILFLMMGISLYIILKQKLKKKEVRRGLFLFFTQLILNSLWSIIFFGLHNPLLAFVEIIFLWLFIILTIVQFSKISKIASYLLIPYLLWVTFAAFLNLYIWILN